MSKHIKRAAIAPISQYSCTLTVKDDELIQTLQNASAVAKRHNRCPGAQHMDIGCSSRRDDGRWLVTAKVRATLDDFILFKLSWGS
jgi:hypothetical protein